MAAPIAIPAIGTLGAGAMGLAGAGIAAVGGLGAAGLAATPKVMQMLQQPSAQQKQQRTALFQGLAAMGSRPIAAMGAI